MSAVCFTCCYGCFPKLKAAGKGASFPRPYACLKNVWLSVFFLAGGFDCVAVCGICTTCENNGFNCMGNVGVGCLLAVLLFTEFMWVFRFKALRFPLYFKLWYFLSFF